MLFLIQDEFSSHVFLIFWKTLILIEKWLVKYQFEKKTLGNVDADVCLPIN